MSAPENPPAFPYSWQWEQPDGERMWKNHDGMSLRDWFAGKIAAEVIGAAVTTKPIEPQPIARDAYRFADAMLAERAKGGAA